MSNAVEVTSRGADVLALTTRDHVEEMGKVANGLFTIPDTGELLLPFSLPKGPALKSHLTSDTLVARKSFNSRATVLMDS